MPATLQIWAPDMYSVRGGIQTYSRFLVGALRDVLPRADLQVLLYGDRQEDLPGAPQPAGAVPVRYRTFGRGPARWRKARFGLAATMGAWRQRPDLVIATHVGVAQPARALRRTPYWVIAHGYEVWDVQRPTWRATLRGAAKVLAVSTYTRDRLIEQDLVPPKRIGLLTNTFDPERFTVADKPPAWLTTYELEPTDPVLLSVTRMGADGPGKGYDQVLEVLPNLVEKLPRLRYLLVGSGSDVPRVRAKIKELGIGDHVTLAGGLSSAALVDHYRLCDAFVLPSAIEGFGIVYLEALACGRPVIGGSHGARDALLDGKLGTLVDPKDRRALEEAILETLAGDLPKEQAQTPDARRNQVVAAFGPDAFRRSLRNHLGNAGLVTSGVEAPAP